jgi:hypothetical protein
MSLRRLKTPARHGFTIYRFDMTSEKLPTEDEEQMNFIKWFRRTYPGVLIFAIPNGGKRNLATAARQKATGTVRGIPDLFVPEWLLWIEMKRQKGGKLSEEQKNIKKLLESFQHCVIVPAGSADAESQVTDFYQTQRKLGHV